jgi:hypothetical protein
MNEAPGTPVEVIRHLGGLTRELDGLTKALRSAEFDMVEKRHAADVAEAHAYLTNDGPVEERKRKAVLATQNAEHAAEVAEALVRVLKRDIRTLEVRIDVGRTFGATVRAEMKTLGYDPAA